jgi:hypothetical protein
MEWKSEKIGQKILVIQEKDKKNRIIKTVFYN